MKDYRENHPKGHMHLMACMEALSVFGFTLREETRAEIDEGMKRSLMPFRLEEGIEVSGPYTSFRDFLRQVGELLAKGEVIVQEVDTLPKPIQLSHDLSNSSEYAISLLKYAWYTRGVSNYNSLVENRPSLIPLYSHIFAQLQTCRLIKCLDVHNVIPLCVGSVLLRTFQLNFPALAIDPSVSLHRQAANLIRSFAEEVDRLKENGLFLLSREILEWLTPILNSQFVRYIYQKLIITHRNWMGKCFLRILATTESLSSEELS